MKTITSAVAVMLAVALFAASAMAGPGRWSASKGNTPGWQLMTAEERTEHQAKMRGFTDYNACKEYVDEHHKKMEERAKAKGVTPPIMKSNSCDMMKAKGMLK